jgi:hypothetical protein
MDAVIQSSLHEDANASVRAITEIMLISRETFRPQMLQKGYTLKALGWIPREPTSDLKLVSLSICFHLFPKLRPHAHDNWQCLVTGDESWFYYEDAQDRIWIARDENTREVGNRMVASIKVC